MVSSHIFLSDIFSLFVSHICIQFYLYLQGISLSCFLSAFAGHFPALLFCLLLQIILRSASYPFFCRLLCGKLPDNVHHNLHCQIHALNGNMLIHAVERIAAGSKVRTRQTLKA